MGRKQYGIGNIYIHESPSIPGVIKVGSARNTQNRLYSIKMSRYAGTNDWINIYSIEVQCMSIEGEIHDFLSHSGYKYKISGRGEDELYKISSSEAFELINNKFFNGSYVPETQSLIPLIPSNEEKFRLLFSEPSKYNYNKGIIEKLSLSDINFYISENIQYQLYFFQCSHRMWGDDKKVLMINLKCPNGKTTRLSTKQKIHRDEFSYIMQKSYSSKINIILQNIKNKIHEYFLKDKDYISSEDLGKILFQEEYIFDDHKNNYSNNIMYKLGFEKINMNKYNHPLIGDIDFNPETDNFKDLIWKSYSSGMKNNQPKVKRAKYDLLLNKTNK